MDAHSLYGRWIDELWAGAAVAAELVTDDFVGHWPERDVHGPAELEQIVKQTRDQVRELSFAVELGPFVDGDFLTGRWRGTGQSPDGAMSFTGNDILRVSADGRRIAEYWTGTSAG